MQYAITLLNVTITILLAINKQILKCSQFCLSAAIMLLKYNSKLSKCDSTVFCDMFIAQVHNAMMIKKTIYCAALRGADISSQ